MAPDTAPISAEDFFHEGTRHLNADAMAEAEIALREALRLAPDMAEAHANLGLVLERTGRVAEAEVAYLHSLTLTPETAALEQCQTLINLGTLWLHQQRFAEAEKIFLRAVSANPESPVAWTNYGVVLTRCQRDAEAEQCFRKALVVAPDHRNAFFNLSYLLLRQGRFEEGWHCMEARQYWQLGEELGIPKWGGEPLAGKSIIIGIEGGFGDMIQFCRFASDLKQRGATRVSVLCHPPIKQLLRSFDDLDDVLAVGDHPAPGTSWDYWCPPLSLPHVLGMRPDSIPARIPYLAAEPELLQKWAPSIDSTDDQFRVGLVWKGNPRFENDHARSLASLDELLPLSEVADIRYFSLQKGAAESEATSPPFPLVNLGKAITDFTDTAAIIMHLDLVITVDTAVAHLAGALGKPCWVLLPAYMTDWRWLTNRNDSPWYPGVMRLFRQKPGDTWAPVILNVKAALEALAKLGKP
jgi:hypothetical protein